MTKIEKEEKKNEIGVDISRLFVYFIYCERKGNDVEKSVQSPPYNQLI